MSEIEHFRSPPDGASILGMTTYRDMIIVATTSGVYVIKSKGRGLDDHEVTLIKAA